MVQAATEIAPPRAILFDWDNTLVDTWPTIHEALNHTLREMKHPEWSLEQVKSSVKKSMRDAFPAMFGDEWEKAADIYQGYYRSIHLNNLQGLPHAEELLQFVRGLPLFVAVVSNKKGDNLRKEVAHIGWGHYFDTVVGAADAERDKPHPDPVHLALKGTDIEPGDHVWFIGDTVIDLECAANTTCRPLLYGPVDTLEGTYEGFPFAHHAPDHQALLRFFRAHF